MKVNGTVKILSLFSRQVFQLIFLSWNQHLLSCYPGTASVIGLEVFSSLPISFGAGCIFFFKCGPSIQRINYWWTRTQLMSRTVLPRNLCPSSVAPSPSVLWSGITRVTTVSFFPQWGLWYHCSPLMFRSKWSIHKGLDLVGIIKKTIVGKMVLNTQL